ncbi:MAG: undecaprenyl-phosphate glucose phosphotransferase [Nitrospinaceae bacterium]|nr:MAG: undecaprenyl-phosphate glucose phosphotransferase [Nitrospinaceae bacterium]
MLKKHGQLFLSAIFISDSLAIFSSWLLAYFIRFQVQFVPVTHGIPPIENYYEALIPIWIVFLVNIKVFGLYQPLRGRSRSGEFFLILKVTAISVLILTAVTFFYREFSYSRIVVVYFWVLATILITLSHWLVRKILSLVRGRGWNLQKVLVVGAGELGQTVVEKLNLHPEIGFQVVGYLTQHPEKIGRMLQGHPVLGPYEEVSKVIRDQGVDQLFIALPLKAHDRLEQVLEYLGEETVDVKVVPDLLQYMNIHSGVEELDGLPIVNLAESPLYGWNVVVKRTSDIILSSLAIVVTAPVMLLIAVLVKMGSRGPVFYRQERVGLDQRVFWMLKFRSMKLEAEKSTGPVWAKENDERRTGIGTFLRKTSLDELPQLFNVLKGEMSLVGPRPERPVFIEDFKQSIPNYMLRLKMKAGLTGWAQVNGWRGNTSLQKRIECDLYYIKNWSLLFDLKILLMTLWRGFINRHAY